MRTVAKLFHRVMNVVLRIVKAPSRGAVLASAPVGFPTQEQDQGPKDQEGHDNGFHLASPGTPAGPLEKAERLPRDIAHNEQHNNARHHLLMLAHPRLLLTSFHRTHQGHLRSPPFPPLSDRGQVQREGLARLKAVPADCHP